MTVQANSNPGLACLCGHHLFVDVLAETGVLVGSWCIWCGTASYDGDLITDNGEPIGFEPTFAVRVPNGFHRRPEERAS